MFWFVFIVLAVLVIWNVRTYNTLSRLKENRTNIFTNMKEQLDKKHDVIDHIVDEVKKTSIEKKKITAILDAQEKAKEAFDVNQSIHAEQRLNRALNSLNFSEISHSTSNNNVLAQQCVELKNINKNIRQASQGFNNTTKEFNSTIQQFPKKMVSRIYGFKRQPFFDANSSHSLIR